MPDIVNCTLKAAVQACGSERVPGPPAGAAFGLTGRSQSWFLPLSIFQFLTYFPRSPLGAYGARHSANPEQRAEQVLRRDPGRIPAGGQSPGVASRHWWGRESDPRTRQSDSDAFRRCNRRPPAPLGSLFFPKNAKRPWESTPSVLPLPRYNFLK